MIEKFWNIFYWVKVKVHKSNLCKQLDYLFDHFYPTKRDSQRFVEFPNLWHSMINNKSFILYFVLLYIINNSVINQKTRLNIIKCKSIRVFFLWQKRISYILFECWKQLVKLFSNFKNNQDLDINKVLIDNFSYIHLLIFLQRMN